MFPFLKWCLASSLVLVLVTSFCIQEGLAQKPTESIHVELIGAEAKDKQSEQVLEALQKLLQAISQKNLEQVGNCLSPDVVSFDDRSRKLISGKQAVLDHISKRVIGLDSDDGIKSFVVYNPRVNVKGDTAMVSFRAVKETGGPKPARLESWCSEVFEHKNDEWLVLHFQSNWKPLKSRK